MQEVRFVRLVGNSAEENTVMVNDFLRGRLKGQCFKAGNNSFQIFSNFFHYFVFFPNSFHN